MDEILLVEGLRMHFHTRHATIRAVDGVDFMVARGETLGLVGESGSGKSTVGYTIIGFYLPTSGRIRFKGENIHRQIRKRPKTLKRELQIVFQDAGSSLNPRHTVRKNLSLPLRVFQPCNRKKRSQMMIELLEMVELSHDYLAKPPTVLSGGEKARVAIARALASDPKLIILDEPTAALDVSIQAKIIKMLLEFQHTRELSYLFISHDLSLMRNVANRVAIMYLGRICESGPTQELFRAPLHPYSQLLLSSIPVITEDEKKLRPKVIKAIGEIPSPVDIPAGCSFHPRCPKRLETCCSDDPTIREVGESHFVRCHLLD